MNSVEKRAILGVGGIFALRMVGLFMIVPVFSVYGDNYAYATPFLIGLAVGIYGLGQAIFQIPMSLAADKFPRKPIIMLGLILFAAGGIIAANATDLSGDHRARAGRERCGFCGAHGIACRRHPRGDAHQGNGDDGLDYCYLHHARLCLWAVISRLAWYLWSILADGRICYFSDAATFCRTHANARAQAQSG